MELVGRVPLETVIAVVPARDQKVWFNGQWLQENELGLIGPDRNVFLVVPGHSRIVFMQAPRNSFQAFFRKLELSTTTPFISEQGRIVSDAVRGKNIRRLMINSRYRETSGEWLHIVENSLMNNFHDLIISNCSQWNKPVKPAIASRFLRFRRVDKFMTQNLHERIRISDLARVAGVSERTLERLFKSEFGMTPTAYITSRRLHNVKTELIQPAVPGRSIAQIAMDQGFDHLGRFSSTYREHFGKTPSLFRQTFREQSAQI